MLELLLMRMGAVRVVDACIWGAPDAASRGRVFPPPCCRTDLASQYRHRGYLPDEYPAIIALSHGTITMHVELDIIHKQQVF